MKYLLFTFLFIASAYIVATLALWKRTVVRNIDISLLSFDQFLILKGFSILIIMVGHLGNLFGVRYLNPLGSLGVAIFLFASGYGMQRSVMGNGLTAFWEKKIRKVYLPYLLMEMFGYAFIYKEYRIKDVIFDLLLFKPMHPFGWFMQCLFICYFAFYLSKVLSKNNHSLQWVILGILVVVLFVLMRSLFKQQALTFVLGVLCAEKSERVRELLSKWGFRGSIISGGAGVCFLAIKQTALVRTSTWIVFYFVEMMQVTLLMMAVVCFFSFCVSGVSCKFFNVFILIGLISYEIYLTHGFFMPKSISFFAIIYFFLISFCVGGLIYVLKMLIAKKRRIKNEAK